MTHQRTTSHVVLSVLSRFFFVTGSLSGLGLTKRIRLAVQPRVCLSRAGITSPCHCASLSHVSFGTWAQFLMSANKYIQYMDGLSSVNPVMVKRETETQSFLLLISLKTGVASSAREPAFSFSSPPLLLWGWNWSGASVLESVNEGSCPNRAGERSQTAMFTECERFLKDYL